jgi:hypothetical protein
MANVIIKRYTIYKGQAEKWLEQYRKEYADEPDVHVSVQDKFIGSGVTAYQVWVTIGRDDNAGTDIAVEAAKAFGFIQENPGNTSSDR